MATLHKIMLAIASSWNNGTSSPAPQGNNRALSNETNALASAFAERQEQTSAKTPPIPNLIGKGIGKFWIPILLVTATLLSIIQIEQLEAASASTNQITRQTPPSYRSKSPTSSTNRVIPPRRNTAPPSRTVVPTYRPSTNRVSRPPLRRTTPSTNQVSRPLPPRKKVVPPTTPSRTTPPPRPTTPSRSTPQAKKKKPGNPPTTPPGRGVGDGIAANYIYDALTGNRVAVSSSMDGTMGAVPAVNQRSRIRRLDTVDGSNYTPGPDNDSEEDSFDANHKWTEYYKIEWNGIIDNPEYDSDDLDSLQYITKSADGEGPGEGESNADYGDDFKTALEMYEMYNGAERGTMVDSRGRTRGIWVEKGKWINQGESQRIKCEHELVDTIQTPNDSRLANGQTYKVGVKWKLERLSNYGLLPSETGHGFITKFRDRAWRYRYLTGDDEFSATSASRVSVKLLEKNTQIFDGPDALGRSRLYWEGIQETVGSSPIFGLGGTTRTRWERRQDDELKGKEKKESN